MMNVIGQLSHSDQFCDPPVRVNESDGSVFAWNQLFHIIDSDFRNDG